MKYLNHIYTWKTTQHNKLIHILYTFFVLKIFVRLKKSNKVTLGYVIFSTPSQRTQRERHPHAERVYVLPAQGSTRRVPLELHSHGLQVLSGLPPCDQRYGGESSDHPHAPAALRTCALAAESNEDGTKLMWVLLYFKGHATGVLATFKFL